MRFSFFSPQASDDTRYILDPQWLSLPNSYHVGDETRSQRWKQDQWLKTFNIPQVPPEKIFQQARARLISMDIISPQILELTAQWNVEGRLPQAGDLLFQRTHLVRLGNIHIIDLLSATRITSVVDEPARFVLQYTTLKGHPEKGISNYIIENNGENVTFSIQSIAKPANIITQLVNPFFTDNRAQSPLL
ncbi:MAG: hypothetical protein CUN55_12775 [Phototrophicales bacterium]|nr:MAG: hypothetical protein CUN55_12775 [Phototrophicales bacterium]